MNSPHLMVADQDPEWRGFCVHALMRRGFAVTQLDQRNLALLAPPLDGSDLLILCLSRVDLEQLDLIRGLAQHVPGLRILVFGTILMADDVRNLFLAGAWDVLDKPFDADELVTIVQEQIDRDAPELPLRRAPEPGRSSRRALVIEDAPVWQRQLTRILSGCGLAVDIVNSESEARAMLSSDAYDIAIVYLRLREADRWDVSGLRLLQSMTPATAAGRVPKVVLSGYATTTYVREAFKCSQVVDVLMKNRFDAVELCTVVARALDGEPIAAPALAP